MKSSRQTVSPSRAALALVLGLLLAIPGDAGAGMQTVRSPSNPLGQQLGAIAGDSSENDPVVQAKRLKALNADRQKALVAETNHLLQLATELNTELNGTHPEALNPEQLHKLAEIEKLARNVREKMSMSVKGLPVFESPFSPPSR